MATTGHQEDDVPTYAYACTVCDHRFDAQQSFTDPALTECPQCQGRLRKLFNAVGIVFKGSGFYRTDSRSSEGRRGAKSPAASSAPSDGASKAASDGKSSDSGTSGSTEKSA
jgi:putative FmdB family regulatory protein